MDAKKKFIIVIIVLGVLTVFSTGIGIYNDRSNSEPVSEDVNKEYKWPQLIAKVTSIFMPKLKPSDLRYSSRTGSSFIFTVNKNNDDSLRILDIYVIPTTDNKSSFAKAYYQYTVVKDSDSDIEKLKKQKGGIEWRRSIDYNTSSGRETDPPQKCSIAVLKQEGKLNITPSRGSKVMIRYKDQNIMLCEITKRGRYNYYK